jgi:hypothetical protein
MLQYDYSPDTFIFLYWPYKGLFSPENFMSKHRMSGYACETFCHFKFLCIFHNISGHMHPRAKTPPSYILTSGTLKE